MRIDKVGNEMIANKAVVNILAINVPTQKKSYTDNCESRGLRATAECPDAF